MRTAFINTLTAMAESDDRLFVISADTGFTVFDDFQKRFPDQYLNIGISESAMIGVAAGLALEGRTVFIYGIVPFVTLRCLEQIRNDLCAHGLPVRIVGVGQGLTYGGEGFTHHAVDDIAALSLMPEMTVVCPGDPVETEHLVAASTTVDGPLYFRLGKSGEPMVHDDETPPIRIGEALTVRSGREVALLSTGNMLATTVDVAHRLTGEGLDPTVVSVHTVKPLDREAVVALGADHRILVTIEEHLHAGGLGSGVADVVAGHGMDVALERVAIPDGFVDFSGSHRHLRDHFGLTAGSIAARVLGRVQGGVS